MAMDEGEHPLAAEAVPEHPPHRARHVASRAIDWFVEPLSQAGDVESYRRARFLVAACLAIAVWGPIFGVVHWANGKSGLIGVLASVGAVGATLPFLFRAGWRVGSSGLIVSVFYFGLLSVLAWATGGQDAPVLWWLASAPMLAAALRGLRTGALFALAAIAEYGFFLAAPDLGYVAPYPFTTEQLPPDLFASMSGLTIIVLSILWVFEASKADAIARLQSANAKLRAETEVRRQAQHELAEARDQALASTRAKSEFLATMSHEIRTPMNGVIGMTSLLMETPLTTEQREFVDTVRTSGDALLTIINDILDFSKIEAGRVELEEQAFDVRAALEEAVDLVALLAQQKGLELTCQCEIDVPSAVVGDVTRVRQVLVNLLSNALKFTETGEIAVTLACRRRDGGDYDLHFQVRDTGIGIPEDRRGRLFQPFSQVDASTTRRFGGTGLGLSIAKRFAELMSGTMWADSTPGQGSTFHFTMLAAEADDRQTDSPNAPELPEGKRVLVVDDNATNLRILDRQLKWWGCEVVTEASPLAALERFRSGEPFDLAILDMQMPDMHGVELASELRSLSSGSDMPLILLSSLGDSEVRGAAAPAEPSTAATNTNLLRLFSSILTKPAKPGRLLEALALAWNDAPPEPARPDSPRAGDRRLAKHRPLRILLAEDNQINQKVACKMLEHLGYRADLAANGIEVLEALERQTYEVILMDMQMPEMDGLEATREIRRRWPAENQPWIIAMTANAMSGHRTECLAAGMDDYLSKPVAARLLAAALERFRRRDETTAAHAPLA